MYWGGTLVMSMRFILALVLMLASSAAFAQSTYTAQVHNACGWQASTTYTYGAGPPTGHFKRVNNGAGWTPTQPGTECGTGSYTPGAALNSYQLLDPGGGHTCASAGSGGPSGTSSSIADGGCTWKYVGPVDYISFTGWALDNGSVWASNNFYNHGHVIQTGSDLSVYQVLNPGGCYSTVQPTGTIPGDLHFVDPSTGLTTSDGCQWGYQGKIYYASRARQALPMGEFWWNTFSGYISGTTLTVTTPMSPSPTTVPNTFDLLADANTRLNATGMTYGTYITGACTGSGVGMTCPVNNSQTLGSGGIPVQIIASSTFWGFVSANDLYFATIWNDREYVGGTNGETSPMKMWNHNYNWNDGTRMQAPLDFQNSAYGAASGYYGFAITIQPAAGEGFADTLTANPSVALSGYNANNGVGFHDTDPTGSLAIGMYDNAIVLRGLQLKSDNGIATGMLARSCSPCTFEHDILEAGGVTVTECGSQCYMYDNLIVAHGTQAIAYDYAGGLFNSTIVCPEGTCKVAVTNTWNWISQGMAMSGNAIFGFLHVIANDAPAVIGDGCLPPPLGTGSPDCATWRGTGNATDLSSTDGNDYPLTHFPGFSNGEMYVQNFATGQSYCSYIALVTGTLTPAVCGILTNVDPTLAFVAWPGNYRIKNASSPLYGGASAYGNFNQCGTYNASEQIPPLGTWSGCTAQADTPDVFGAARPTAGRYDIGAVQFGGVAPVLNTPGRFFFR